MNVVLLILDFLSQCKCRRAACETYFKLLVSAVSIFVFVVVGVVFVVVFWFLSAVSMVHS